MVYSGLRRAAEPARRRRRGPARYREHRASVEPVPGQEHLLVGHGPDHRGDSGRHPLTPIQLTLISAITIGIPGFLLALGPNRRRYVPGFLRRVLRFALPPGIVTGIAAYLGYPAARASRHRGRRAHHGDSRGVDRLVVDPAHPGPAAGRLEAGAGRDHGGGVAVIVAIPPLGHGIFLLDTTPSRLLTAAIIGAAGAFLLERSYRAVGLIARQRDT